MKVLQKSLIAMSLLSATSAVYAEGAYISISAGKATYDSTLEDFAILDDGSITTADLDDSDTSLNISLGYQLTPNFAIEGGYVDLGELAINGTSDGSGFLYAPGPVNFAIAIDGLFLDFKGTLPLNEQFGLYGKIGMLKYDVEVTLADSTGGISISDDDTDSFFGGGISFRIGEKSAFNLDYTRYTFEDEDVNVISAGLQFGF